MAPMQQKLAAIILAAGKGVRMRSDLPKVFHRLLDRPILDHVIQTVKALNPSRVFVVVGYKKELIMDYFKDAGVGFVIQAEQLGTGHAVMQAESQLKDFEGEILVLAGDVPLLRSETLKELIEFHREHKASATDLTAKLPDAGNYGRVVRDAEGHILKIVEKKDASQQELEIREINTGTFCFDSKVLFEVLKEIKPENVQKEYYLTDTIEIMRKKGLPVFACKASDYKETLGINTKEQLQELENHLKATP